MKVTIDSSESLESAIRVLGAMYDVTLTVATQSPSHAAKSRPSGKAAPGTSTRSRAAKTTASVTRTKRPRHASRTTANAVSASELRSWARANGYQIGNYGRIPAAVATAYREAHHS